MTDLKTMQQQLEAFVKMYKDKDLSDRCMQELPTHVEEYLWPDHLTVRMQGVRATHTNLLIIPRQGTITPVHTTPNYLFLNLQNWSFRTLMASLTARKTHYHDSHGVTIFSPIKTLHIARNF